jgi:hypothetical protein
MADPCIGLCSRLVPDGNFIFYHDRPDKISTMSLVVAYRRWSSSGVNDVSERWTEASLSLSLLLYRKS